MISTDRISRRPALSALALSVVAILGGGAAAAQAGSGDVGSTGGTTTGSGSGSGSGSGPTAGSAGTAACPATELGSRPLHIGDCGEDVATLNWILKAKN